MLLRIKKQKSKNTKVSCFTIEKMLLYLPRMADLRKYTVKNFAFYCKSYIKDVKHVSKLVESFNKYNVENIHLYISVPATDIDFFIKFASKNITVIKDEDYALSYLTTENAGRFSAGYVNQEICKLSFWESKLALNYLCIDSDACFIRDFKFDDFMYTDTIPYTILVMDKDLSVERYYKKFWKYRIENIKKIYEEVGLDDKRYRSSHGVTILNAKVLESFKKDFMQSKGYSYRNLIEIAPFEFTWYNAWFQKCKLVEEVAVEPFFKTFHCKIEYKLSRMKNIKLEDYARSYVGIVINSNWGRNAGNYKNPSLIDKFIYFLLKKMI